MHSGLGLCNRSTKGWVKNSSKLMRSSGFRCNNLKSRSRQSSDTWTPGGNWTRKKRQRQLYLQLQFKAGNTEKRHTSQLSWWNQKAGSLSSSHFCVPLPLSVQVQILPHGGCQQIIFTHHPTIKLIQQQQNFKKVRRKKSVYFELFYRLTCLGQFNLVTKFHSACCSFWKNNSYTPNWGNHSFGFHCSSLW